MSNVESRIANRQRPSGREPSAGCLPHPPSAIPHPPFPRLLLALFVLLTLPASLAAMTPAELVGHDLQREQVAVTSLQNGTLSYFDSQRRLQQASVQGFVQLRAIGGREARLPASEPVAELTDGQRFVGQWGGGSSDGESLRWRHADLGAVALPLDRLRVVRFRMPDDDAARQAVQTIATGPTPAQDTVALVNGDRLRGFVLELTETAVVLMPEGEAGGDGGGASGGEAWELPHERIALLRLANPDASPEPGRQVMMLGDGSRVLVTGLAIGRDQVRYTSALREAAEPGQIDLGRLAGVDFTAHGRRLVPLADQRMQVTAGGEVFGLPAPPRTLGRTLQFHAPVAVRFDLPDTAERFTAIAELATGDGDAPPHLPDWADFELVVHHGGDAGEKRYRLHGSQPSVEINVPIHDATLRLEVDPGVNGPILDRLRLRDPLLLIHEPTDPSPASDAGL